MGQQVCCGKQTDHVTGSSFYKKRPKHKKGKLSGDSLDTIARSTDTSRAQSRSNSAHSLHSREGTSNGPTTNILQPLEIINSQSFEKLKVIGRGGFSKVFLVKKISDGKIYAMKQIRKDRILKADLKS